MPAPGPGVWELPAGQSPLVPWLSRLRPFTLRSPDQFRPARRPRSQAAATRATSTSSSRSGGAVSAPHAEQTLIARFYTTHPALQFNTAYRDLAGRQGLNAIQAARLMAMGNAVGADALIACFDAKYRICSGGRCTRSRAATRTATPGPSRIRTARRCCRRRRTRSTRRRTAA